MLVIRRLCLAALALALVMTQLIAAPIPGVKAGGDDGDKWLLDDAEVIMVFNFKQLFDSKLMKGGYTDKLRDAIKNNEKAKEAMDKLCMDVAAYNTRIMGPAHVEPAADLACRTALSYRQVAHLTFPVDIQDQEVKEQSRETETKRIKNPDDESQFVEVENIKKLVTEQGEGAKYQKSTYTFTNK